MRFIMVEEKTHQYCSELTFTIESTSSFWAFFSSLMISRFFVTSKGVDPVSAKYGFGKYEFER